MPLFFRNQPVDGGPIGRLQLAVETDPGVDGLPLDGLHVLTGSASKGYGVTIGRAPGGFHLPGTGVDRRDLLPFGGEQVLRRIANGGGFRA